MAATSLLIADDHPLFRAALRQAAQDAVGSTLLLHEAGTLEEVLATLDATPDIDLVLLDVKSGIPETYQKVTGRALQPTIDFGDRLSERGIEIWVRFVLVPGLTDAPENIDAVARIASRWGSLSRLEVLPFHQMGRDKWAALHMDYALADAQPPSMEQVDEVRARFRSFGLTVH